MEDKAILKKILSMIVASYTNDEICQKLNMTHNELYVCLNNLKRIGFTFKNQFYEDGSIIYYIINNESALEKEANRDYAKILTKSNSDTLRAIAISDLHFGNPNEGLYQTCELFDYAIKNGINIFFNIGDFIDGTFGQDEKTIAEIYDQIEYFIKKYPHDNSILTFGVGGDHDYSAFRVANQDFITFVSSYRGDIIIPSYNRTNIFVKEDAIALEHHIDGINKIGSERSIVLHGHHHEYYANMAGNNVLHIKVPSLSSIGTNMPSALDITFEFNQGYINGALIRQLIFKDGKIVEIGKNHYSQFGILNGQPHGLSKINVVDYLPSERKK